MTCSIGEVVKEHIISDKMRMRQKYRGQDVCDEKRGDKIYEMKRVRIPQWDAMNVTK